MIKIGSRLSVIDNSGALEVECINVPKLYRRIGGVPGCVLTITVKKNIFKKNIKKKSKIITKGQVIKALLVSSVKMKKRYGNIFIASSTNSVVLLNQYALPYGTRLLGPLFREVRQKINYRKIISLARVII